MDENIQIAFNYSDKIITLHANIETPFSELSKRFCKEIGILDNNLIYLFDNREILPTNNRSLSQLNIHNNSLIIASLNISIIFFCEGKLTVFRTIKETKFSDLSELFLNITGLKERDPVYFHNSKKIDSTDCRTLAELKIGHQSKIDVVFSGEVIAA